MRQGLRSLRTATALLLLASGPATGDESADTAAPVPRPPCLERAPVVTYLHALQDAVMEKWVIDEDTLADQVVDVRFRIVYDGRLRDFAVVSSSNHRLKNRVELAFASTAPVGPVPDAAACLIERPITMRFENPY